MATDDSIDDWYDRLQTEADALDEYVETVHARNEHQVKSLLRTQLVHSGTFELFDKLQLEIMLHQYREGAINPIWLRSEHARRMIQHATEKTPGPWEGITWVLDCLPHWPAYALNAIQAYVYAHAQGLPDGALIRLHNAQAIIRAYYIGLPDGQSDRVALLRTIDARGFECVVYRLYKEMGYETTLTQARRDGGRDAIARRTDPGRAEDLRVECKNWGKPVGVKTARELLGVVSSERVNKGVIVSATTFTRGARLFAMDNPRIELIAGKQLVQLLNEHLGARWPVRIDQLAAEPGSSLESLGCEFAVDGGAG